MTIEDALETAREFLGEYTLDDAYHEVVRDGETVDRMLYLQEAFDTDGKIELQWAIESDEGAAEPDAPDVVALVEKAIAALRKAHPELKSFAIEYKISP
jgi:hypothetical protein